MTTPCTAMTAGPSAPASAAPPALCCAPSRLLRPLTLRCTRRRGAAEGEGAQRTGRGAADDPTWSPADPGDFPVKSSLREMGSRGLSSCGLCRAGLASREPRWISASRPGIPGTEKVIQRGHGGALLLGPLMFRWTTCVRLDHLNAVGPPGSRNTVVQRNASGPTARRWSKRAGRVTTCETPSHHAGRAVGAERGGAPEPPRRPNRPAPGS